MIANRRLNIMVSSKVNIIVSSKLNIIIPTIIILLAQKINKHKILLRFAKLKYAKI